MKIDVEDIRTITLKDNQVLVIDVDDDLSWDQVMSIRDTFRKALPEARLVIKSRGVSITAVDVEDGQ